MTIDPKTIKPGMWVVLIHRQGLSWSAYGPVTKATAKLVMLQGGRPSRVPLGEVCAVFHTHDAVEKARNQFFAGMRTAEITDAERLERETSEAHRDARIALIAARIERRACLLDQLLSENEPRAPA